MNNETIISMQRCFFIDLLDKLEHYDFDFVDLSAFKNYVFMAPLNEYKYLIHSISNDKETYTLHYCQKHKIKSEKNEVDNKIIQESSIDDIILAKIPYGTFNPTKLYDFEVNLTQKTFRLINEYVVIDIHDIITDNVNVEKDNKNQLINKKRNRLLHLLGC
jgi:hypothetical protein